MQRYCFSFSSRAIISSLLFQLADIVRFRASQEDTPNPPGNPCKYIIVYYAICLFLWIFRPVLVRVQQGWRQKWGKFWTGLCEWQESGCVHICKFVFFPLNVSYIFSYSSCLESWRILKSPWSQIELTWSSCAFWRTL